QIIARVLLLQFARKRQRVRESLLALIQAHQQQLRVIAFPPAVHRDALQSLQTSLLRAARADETGDHFCRQRQAAEYVLVKPDRQLGIMESRIEFDGFALSVNTT